MPAINAALQPESGASHADGARQASSGLPSALHDFAVHLNKTRGIPLDHAQALLSDASFTSGVARLMTPPKNKAPKSWSGYRNRFVEPIRIREGIAFWESQRDMLDAVATRHGVPASIIVAIIGVETLYGKHMGSFRVLDSLYTLGFHFPDAGRPERAAFFREQLADLIQLDYERKLDARRVLGSYAGAMGMPQFMPGSLIRYASDGSNDGKIDLFGNTHDAIASVASFLRQHGWQPGLPVFAPVHLPPGPASLADGGLEPKLTWKQLQDRGALVNSPAARVAWQAHPLGVIDLPEEPRGTVEYRTATPNFFALTQYNRSYFYAASVNDLAEELAQRMGYGGPN